MNLLEELRSLDPRDPGRWPLPIRAGAVAIAFLVLLGAGHLLPGVERAAPGAGAVAAEEQTLRQEFQDKHAKAVNLELYKQQLKDIERSFGALLRQLPGRTEVPNLLVDISQTGLAAGLEEKLFQPQPEQKKDFYAELPIKIRLTGSYHQFGEFVSGIAALPRIVTLHDIEIKPDSKSLRPAVPGADGEDLPLPGRGRDRRGRGGEEGRRHAPPRGRDQLKSAGMNPVRTMHKHPHRNGFRISCMALACAGYLAAHGLLERRRRARALHRGHEEGAGRPRRAAAGGQAVRDLRVRRDRPALAVPAEQPRFRRRPGRRAPGPEAQPRVPRAVLARHLEDGRHAALGGPIYGLVQTKDGLVHRVSAGNYIGQADGKITDITPSKISVVEIVPDGLGGYMERPAALALNE